MARRKTRLVPYSRPQPLGELDGRTREGKFLRRTRAELAAHVGGNPSATQRALIDRACFLMLRVALLDEKQRGGNWTEHDSRTYLAWCSALTRLMRQLGLKGAAERPPSLAEHIARHGASAA